MAALHLTPIATITPPGPQLPPQSTFPSLISRDMNMNSPIPLNPQPTSTSTLTALRLNNRNTNDNDNAHAPTRTPTYVTLWPCGASGVGTTYGWPTTSPCFWETSTMTVNAVLATTTISYVSTFWREPTGFPPVHPFPGGLEAASRIVYGENGEETGTFDALAAAALLGPGVRTFETVTRTRMNVTDEGLKVSETPTPISTPTLPTPVPAEQPEKRDSSSELVARGKAKAKAKAKPKPLSDYTVWVYDVWSTTKTFQLPDVTQTGTVTVGVSNFGEVVPTADVTLGFTELEVSTPMADVTLGGHF